MESPIDDRICKRCRRIVDKTKRFAIMVDGILDISVPLCLPCYVTVEESVNEVLTSYPDTRIRHAV